MSQPAVSASLGNIAYQVKLVSEQQHWLSDVPRELGGGDTGPDPHQLLLSALGACTSITVAMYAQRKGLPLESIEVQLSYQQEPTKQLAQSRISRDITLHGPLSDEQRQRLLEIANACPIHKVLSNPIAIDSQLV